MGEPRIPIVVGVDGSESANEAVQLAARLAAWHDRPLRVIHAFVWPELRVPLGPPVGGPPDSGLSNMAQQIVADAEELVHKIVPDLPVTGQVINGAPAPVLLEASDNAAMVVVGNRGLGGFGSLLLGSVAVEVATHVRCPVVIARGAEGGDSVLLGLDGSPNGSAAAAFAFKEASRRNVPVTALHAYAYPVVALPGYLPAPAFDMAEIEAEQRRVLDDTLAQLRQKYPDVTTSPLLVADRAANALVEQSRESALVVVGSRGLGGFRGLLLGSITHAVMHHAHCPVAVIH